jgi:hypothetical protein
MKGTWGQIKANNMAETCPSCKSASGPKTKCESCNTVGCCDCIGMEKPNGCKNCGRGPVVYID